MAAARRDAVIGHHDHEHAAGDQEVDQPGPDRRDRDDQPGEVDLGDQPLAPDDALAGAADRVGEERPGQQPGEHEQRVGQATRRHACQPPEEQAEDDHRHQGLQNGPGGAEDRLLVPDLHVPPRQEEEQLASLPQLSEVDGLPAGGRLDDRQGPGGRHRGHGGERGCPPRPGDVDQLSHMGRGPLGWFGVGYGSSGRRTVFPSHGLGSEGARVRPVTRRSARTSGRRSKP